MMHRNNKHFRIWARIPEELERSYLYSCSKNIFWFLFMQVIYNKNFLIISITTKTELLNGTRYIGMVIEKKTFKCPFKICLF